MGARSIVVQAAVLAGVLAAPGATRAEPVRYRFDPTHTFVYFELLHFGTSTIRGRFGSPPGGDAVLDRAARKGRVQVEIDTATVNTGVPVLDARLKEGDMLAVGATRAPTWWPSRSSSTTPAA